MCGTLHGAWQLIRFAQVGICRLPFRRPHRPSSAQHSTSSRGLRVDEDRLAFSRNALLMRLVVILTPPMTATGKPVIKFAAAILAGVVVSISLAFPLLAGRE